MRRTGPASRIMTVSAVLTLIVGGVGFILAMVLNAFVLDEFDAYGEVPIPGSGQIQLPAGEVEISFHTLLAGRPSGGFPLPPLKLSIIPPDGAADPVLIENHSATTTVNSDTHMRVWIAQVPAAGTYQIRTDGLMGGYIDPRLAFGRESRYEWLTGAFAATVGVGLLELTAAIFLSKRQRRAQLPAAGQGWILRL